MHALGMPLLALVPAGHIGGARDRAVGLAAAEGSIGRHDWSISQGRSTTSSMVTAKVRRRPGRSEQKYQLTPLSLPPREAAERRSTRSHRRIPCGTMSIMDAQVMGPSRRRSDCRFPCGTGQPLQWARITSVTPVVGSRFAIARSSIDSSVSSAKGSTSSLLARRLSR